MQALRTAQKNIKAARDQVEEMLGHLDTARQVSTARRGPCLCRGCNAQPLRASARKHANVMLGPMQVSMKRVDRLCRVIAVLAARCSCSSERNLA